MKNVYLKYLPKTGIAIAFVILTFGTLFYLGFLRCNYPDYIQFPVQGIDISHHQGVINWKAVDTNRYRFVFIKATEGGDFVDPRFSANWSQARNRGLHVGAYHFFTFKKTGIEQAGNFISTVPVNRQALPPVIDLEYMGNSSIRLSRKQFGKELADYIGLIEKRYRKKPILYVTYEFYNYYLSEIFKNYPIWIRDIYMKPELPNNRKWMFWQYTNRGRIRGIESYVDLNVFNGSYDKLLDFIK